MSRLAGASPPAASLRGLDAVFVAVVAHAPLRDPLRGPSGLHRVLLPSVPAGRCAKATLGAGHRFAPFG
jgi:hypothetical protein